MPTSTVPSFHPEDLASFLKKRRLPLGGEVVSDGQVHFRVWAPAARRVAVVFAGEAQDVSLAAEPDGYFSGIAQANENTRYRIRLDATEQLYPDPASRYQPDGPHGPSL